MINEVVIPKTGLNLEDCLFLRWLVEEGAKVDVGQPIFEMETEKVEVEVVADDAGYLHQLGVPDTSYPVGSVVGYIAATEDEYRSLL